MIKDVINGMVVESAAGTVGLDISSAANQERDLALAGTFQAALHAQVSDTVAAAFAVALSHIDRNSGGVVFLLHAAQLTSPPFI